MGYGSTGRRVAAVSTGTLLLCLWGGGTAFAATSPTSDGSGGVIGTVTGVLSPTASPTAAPLPVPTPSQLDAVTQTVNTTVTTVKNAVQPQSSPTATPTAMPTGGKVAGGHTSGGVRVPSAGGSNDQVLGTHQTRSGSSGTMTVPTVPLNISGLRAAGAPSVPTLNPQVAPEQTAILAAGSTPAIAPAPRAAIHLPTNDGRAPRGLFIALATMVIGGLAAGHVKVAQDRMGYTSY